MPTIGDVIYKAWQETCNKLDEQLEKYKTREHKKCPFCGGEPEAWWNYNSDYLIYVNIECTGCGCRFRESSLEECEAKWNRRTNEKQEEK